MARLVKILVCAAVLGVWAGTLPAQDAVGEQMKAQNKLLAQRAARVDAIRKLAERIRGLSLTSNTTVKDFVTESDEINTSMQAFLAGAAEVGKPKYNEDGTCEVTMEVTLRELVATLKQIRNRYYKGNRFKAEDFDHLEVTATDKVLRETGSGAPRPELAVEPGVPVRPGESLDSMTFMSAGAKAFWMAHVQPAGRLMAVRAARVDGMRRLAERIKGVFITSNTMVKDFVAESDEATVNMETFLRGAREARIRYHADELIVEVEMEVTLRTVYATLKLWGESHFRGNRAEITRLEELSVRSEDTLIKETGMGVPPQRLLKDVMPGMEDAMAMAMKGPDWIGTRLKAVGSAAIDTENTNAAQAKLMAFRGAEIDARRKLAEQINGLVITSNTTVKDFVTQNDDIQTSMMTFQQGAHVVEGSQKVMEDGSVQATVEIDLRPLWDMILFYQKKLSIKLN